MTDALVAAADPEWIILFGSQARGQTTKHSDLDFLVVKNRSRDESRLEEMRNLRHALRSFRIPKDILVYSPEEVEKWRQTTNHVVARAIREGKVLYERP